MVKGCMDVLCIMFDKVDTSFSYCRDASDKSQNFLKVFLEREYPILLHSTKFPENKASEIKFPEFRKFPENLHPCY